MIEQGYWLESGIRNIKPGLVEWNGLPRRSYAASVAGRPVAAVRRQPYSGGWLVNIEGWMWHVTEDMGSSRFPLLHVPIKSFRTSKEGRHAVEEAFRLLAKIKS